MDRNVQMLQNSCLGYMGLEWWLEWYRNSLFSHHITPQITALQTFISVQVWGSEREDVHIPQPGMRNSCRGIHQEQRCWMGVEEVSQVLLWYEYPSGCVWACLELVQHMNGCVSWGGIGWHPGWGPNERKLQRSVLQLMRCGGRRWAAVSCDRDLSLVMLAWKLSPCLQVICLSGNRNDEGGCSSCRTENHEELCLVRGVSPVTESRRGMWDMQRPSETAQTEAVGKASDMLKRSLLLKGRSGSILWFIHGWGQNRIRDWQADCCSHASDEWKN